MRRELFFLIIGTTRSAVRRRNDLILENLLLRYLAERLLYLSPPGASSPASCVLTNFGGGPSFQKLFHRVELCLDLLLGDPGKDRLTDLEEAPRLPLKNLFHPRAFPCGFEHDREGKRERLIRPLDKRLIGNMLDDLEG